MNKYQNSGEFLHFSHFHQVSLVQWTNRLLPPQGAAVRIPGVQPTLWNWDYLLVPSCYSSDLTESLITGLDRSPDLSHWLL
jgi:hypothetical protein